MRMQDNYYEVLVELTKNLDFNTQIELINSYKQSISDLDLEKGTFDQITERLGTPEQFYNEFQLEMDKQKIKDEDRITTHIHLFGGELGEFPFQSKK